MSEITSVYPERVRDCLHRVNHILDVGRLDSYDWLLVARLMIDATKDLAHIFEPDLSPIRQTYNEVFEAFLIESKNFTDPIFIKATKAARREMPKLFRSK